MNELIQKLPQELSEPTTSQPYEQRQEEGSSIEAQPTWMDRCGKIACEWKYALARYAATHYVAYGDGIMLGSGTTLNSLADEIFAFQLENNLPYDLKISSTNLQVIAKGRRARATRVDLFASTQLNLIGGTHINALDSLVGEYAVSVINNDDLLVPDVIFFGAAAVTFSGKLRIGYQFQEELSVQCALAARCTRHRVLMFDHTKFKTGGWTAKISLETLLSNTPRCSILSTYPDNARERGLVDSEVAAFAELLKNLAETERTGHVKLAGKDIQLILINKDSEEVQDKRVSLSDIRVRQQRTQAAACKTTRPNDSRANGPTVSDHTNGKAELTHATRKLH